MTQDFRSLWSQIGRLRALDLEIDESELRFDPGAPEREIAQAEAKLGFVFPPELRASYAVHRDVGDPFGSCEFGAWGYTAETIEANNEWLKSRPPMKVSTGARAPVFGAQLVPFAFGNETSYCIDMNPADGGKVGQVVAVNFEKATCKVVASSFGEFLHQGIKSLEKRLAKRASGKAPAEAPFNKPYDEQTVAHAEKEWKRVLGHLFGRSGGKT